MHDLHAICRAGVFKETLRIERRGVGEQIAELPCGTVVGKSRVEPTGGPPPRMHIQQSTVLARRTRLFRTSCQRRGVAVVWP
jgi:hypothetical protein